MADMFPIPNRSRAWLFAALLLLTPVAGAQMSMSASAGSTAAAIVEEETVIANATDAFAAATARRLDEAGLSEAWRAEADAAVRRARASFARELGVLVNELKGDGLLEAGEVSDEIGALRERFLDVVERELTAMEAGYPPPPRRERPGSRAEHALAMTKYTVQVRNEATDWLLLLGAIGGGFLLAWLVNSSFEGLGKRLRKAGHRDMAHMLESLTGPLYLAIVGWALRLGFEWMWIPGLAGEVIERVVTTAWIAALFWFAWNMCQTLARGLVWVLRKTYNRQFDDHVVLILSRLLRVVVLGIFSLLIVKHIFDSSLTGLVAGLGIVGVALSFILRGTIENIAASFTILGDKPFRVGDLIVHDGAWGTVEHIGFRSTRFRTLQGHLITIPNSRLIDNEIHNAGARPSIRRRFRIGLTYDTAPAKIEEAIEIIRDILADHRGQPADQPPHVVFEAYGEHQLTLMVQYYFEPADYWKALEFDTHVNLQIKRRFDEAGIEFAFPTRTVYLQRPDESHGVGSDENEGSGDARRAANARGK